MRHEVHQSCFTCPTKPLDFCFSQMLEPKMLNFGLVRVMAYLKQFDQTSWSPNVCFRFEQNTSIAL